MPFPFTLGTTSHLTFQANFTSSTHPSLPATATAQRNIVRSTLKSHKRLGPEDQSSNLNNIASCILDYVKYLNAIDFALSGKAIAGEDVEIALTKEVEVEWRPTLSSSSVPGREPDRLKGKGLDYEIYFIHQTYATVQNLLARQSLLGLYASTNPSTEQRKLLIQNALKQLRSAYSIHSFLNTRNHSPEGSSSSFPPSATDILPTTQTALLRLTYAEINLLCVLKDDPYPALLVQSRNKDDKEWMIKAPTIPKVRTQVLTRLCIGAAEHATAASAAMKAAGNDHHPESTTTSSAAKAMLTKRTGGNSISKELVEYVDDIRRTARARACRFQALDNDLSGSTGQAIAWLHAAMNELGMDTSSEFGSSDKSAKTPGLGLSKFKQAWTERKEDKKISRRANDWGKDGGKIEEGRIVEYLLKKFNKANDTVNIQLVPEWRPLLALLPGGMNMPIGEDNNWVPPLLSEEELIAMRGPPDMDDYAAAGASSGEDDGTTVGVGGHPVGAFPGTQNEYSKQGQEYY